MTESNEQALLVAWFKTQYPKYAKNIFAIPNDLKMAYKARNPFAFKVNMKKEGLLPGVSDLFIAVPIGKYHGLFLEMKDKGKTWCSVKPEQREFLKQMIDSGYAGAWCAGFDHARGVVTEYMENRFLVLINERK